MPSRQRDRLAAIGYTLRNCTKTGGRMPREAVRQFLRRALQAASFLMRGFIEASKRPPRRRGKSRAGPIRSARQFLTAQILVPGEDETAWSQVKLRELFCMGGAPVGTGYLDRVQIVVNRLCPATR